MGWENGIRSGRRSPAGAVAAPGARSSPASSTARASTGISPSPRHRRPLSHRGNARPAARPGHRRGVRLPATLTASGVALLAALPPRHVRACFYERDSRATTPADPRRSRTSKRLLVDTRARGMPWSTTPSARSRIGRPGGPRPHRAPGRRLALTFPVEEIGDVGLAGLGRDVADAAATSHRPHRRRRALTRGHGIRQTRGRRRHHPDASTFDGPRRRRPEMLARCSCSGSAPGGRGRLPGRVRPVSSPRHWPRSTSRSDSATPAMDYDGDPGPQSSGVGGTPAG